MLVARLPVWLAVLALVPLGLRAQALPPLLDGVDCACTETGSFKSPRPGVMNAPELVAPVTPTKNVISATEALSPGGIYRIIVEGTAQSGYTLAVKENKAGGRTLVVRAVEPDAQWGFGPDGTRFVYWFTFGGLLNVSLYDLTKPTPLSPVHEEFPLYTDPLPDTTSSAVLGFSPSGEHLLVGNRADAVTVDVTLLSGDAPSFTVHGTLSTAWGFSPQGNRLAYWWMEGNLYNVRLYDLTTPTPTAGRIYRLSLYTDAGGGDAGSGFSPDGAYFLVGARTGAQETTMSVIDMTSTRVSESTTEQVGWGFGPNGYELAYWSQAFGQEAVSRYDLRKAAPLLGTSRAGLGGGSSAVVFSPNGHYLLYAALTRPNEASLAVLDAEGKARYTTSFSFYLAPAEKKFGNTSWKFSPDDADRSLVLNWVLGQQSTQWMVVNLDRGEVVQARELATVSSYARFSPCGDVVGLIEYTASGWAAHLYSTRLKNKGLGNNSYSREPLLRTTSETHQAAPAGGSYAALAVNTAGQSCAAPPPPVVAGLTLAPAQVMGGKPAEGTITLDKAAPAGGAVVSLASSLAAVEIPESVTIPAGMMQGEFAIETQPVRDVRTATITASLDEREQTATLKLLPPELASLSGPASIVGGNPAAFTVALEVPAPEGGMPVRISSDVALALVPDTVWVSEGDSEAYFNVETAGVATASAVTLTATLGGITKTRVLMVQPASLTAFALKGMTCPSGDGATAVIGGRPVVLSVRLDGLPAPTGALIQFNASSGSVQIPPSHLIQPDRREGIIVVQTKWVTATEVVTFQASYRDSVRTFTLTLTPAPYEFDVQDLGLPAGASVVERAYLNNAGQVVVSAASSGSFLWTNGTYSLLPTPTGTVGVARDLNDFGVVAGYLTNVEAGKQPPGVWRGGPWEPLEEPAGGYALVNALNNMGDVVGGARDALGKQRPAVWRDGKLEFLPAMGFYPLGNAEGINNAGQIVGTALPDGPIFQHALYHAFVMHPGGVPAPLAPYNQDATAQALNNYGEIVVSAGYQGSGYVWDTTPRRAAGAFAINDAGFSVGYTYLPDFADEEGGTSVAVFADTAGTYNLNCLIPPEIPWLITRAHDLNSLNQITATGRDAQGEVHPVLLSMKHPGPVADLAVALTEGPQNLVAGEAATYTFEVKNEGAAAAQDAAFGSFLFGPMTPTAATSTSGTCTVEGEQARCALGTLAPGATATVTIAAQSVAEGMLRTSAFVHSHTLESDGTDNGVRLDVSILAEPAETFEVSVESGAEALIDLGADIRVQFTDPSDTPGTLVVSRYDGAAPNHDDLLILSVQTPSGPVTPSKVSDAHFWTVEAQGISSFAYTVCLNVTDLPDLPAADRLVVVKRTHGGDSWLPLATTVHQEDGRTWLCTAGLTSFSQFGLAYADSDLPVELVAFEAVADGAGALLRWQTAAETNNAGFELEHRLPGASAYVSRGFVAGHGTTAEARQYEQAVENLEPGRHTFRLKQVDFDGAAAYSEEVSVEIGFAGRYAFTAPYPNPTASTASFALTLLHAEPVVIDVFDVMGRRVARLHEGELAAGSTHRFTFDVADVPSGTYFVRVTGMSIRETHRLTVAR